MEKLFGRSYESVGDTSGDLILKTRGNVKVQVGSSFVDLIKGGEINVSVDIVKEASSKDKITNNGIYLVDNVVYVKYQDTVLPLNDTESRNYVSYLAQTDITSEEQIQAQQNIGVYYNMLEDAVQAVTNGFVFIKNKGLYNIINSSAYQLLSTDYLLNNALTISELTVSNLLKVGNTSISQTALTLADNFIIQLNSQELLSISNSQCKINNSLVINSLQSPNGNLKLYLNQNTGDSYLMVDHIICSNSNQEYSPVITKTQYYYPDYNNVITSITSNTTIEEGSATETITGYTLELSNYFEYKAKDILHVEYSNTTYDFIVQSVSSNKVTVSLADSTLDPTTIGQKVICYGKPTDETQIGFIIKDNTITYGNNITKTVFGTLPTGLDYTNGIYSEAMITKNQILETPQLKNATFKKSDNFPKLEEGWELSKDDNSQCLATTKWVNSNKYELPIANSSVLGGIMVGNGLSITNTGTLSVVDNWTDTLDSLSSTVSSHTSSISTMQSQISNLQKAVQDLQDSTTS